MDLFFLRHAIAVQRGTSEYPNDDRPLTKDGIRKMKKAARGIATLVDSFDVILSSPLVRAYDTARIAADAVKYTSDIEQCGELLPGAGTAEFLALLEHLPGVQRSVNRWNKFGAHCLEHSVV